MDACSMEEFCTWLCEHEADIVGQAGRCFDTPLPAGSRKPMDRSTALTRACMDEPHKRGGNGDLFPDRALRSIIAWSSSFSR
jgi:hypothetical protein